MKAWLHQSFRTRVLLSILLTVLFPILLCNVLMLNYMVMQTGNTQEAEALQELSQCSEAIRNATVRAEAIAQRLSQSTVVRSVLRKKSTDSTVLYQMLYRETEPIRGLCRVDIYLADGTSAYTSDETYVAHKYPTYWSGIRAASETDGMVYFTKTNQSQLKGALAVRAYDRSVLGYITITFTEQNLHDLLFGHFSINNDIMLFNAQGRLFYGSNPVSASTISETLRAQFLSGQTLDGGIAGESRLYSMWFLGTGFLVLVQPLAFTQTALDTFNLISTVSALLCIALALIYALWISHHLAAPINLLSKAMGRVEQGELDVQVDLKRNDEVGHLGEAFNRMTREYRDNLEASLQRQKDLDEIRVRMMQAQLNPHFLYNTLDSVKWLGITNHVPQVADLATNLAVLLRTSISGDEFIPLEQELEIVDRYLEIQYIRFADAFTCEIDVEHRFMHCMVPKLSLQPLVENAIIHGVSDSEEGYIKITAAQNGGTLILRVSDNGKGLDPAAIERLLNPEVNRTGKHLGLFNVNRIIQLHYGNTYGLRVFSTPGQGSTVELHLPMLLKSDVPTEREDIASC